MITYHPYKQLSQHQKCIWISFLSADRVSVGERSKVAVN